MTSLLCGALTGITMLAMGSCSPKAEAVTDALSKAEPSTVAIAALSQPQESADTSAPLFVVQTSPPMIARSLEARSSTIPGRTVKAGEKVLRAQEMKADQALQVSPAIIDKQNRELMDSLTVKPR